MKKLLLTIVLCFGVMGVFAQSPMTGIGFYKAYLDVPIVKSASTSNGLISDAMLDYIFKKSNPAEVKYAIVNALGYRGKAAKNERVNNNAVANYFTNNFDITMDYEDLLRTFGVSTTMAVIYFSSVSDTTDLSYNINAVSAIHDANIVQNQASRATEIIGALIQAQNIINGIPNWEIVDVDGQIDMMTHAIMKNEEELCQAKATNIVKNVSLHNDEVYDDDMKRAAIDIVWNYMKKYNKEVGIIKIISKSLNPYSIKVNGNEVKVTESKEEWEYLCAPGYYHIEATQQSGYMFSPTINRKDVNVTDGETIEIEIGY